MKMSVVAGGNGLPGLDRVPIWFNDPSNWWGPDGLVVRTREHLLYTGTVVLVAALIALPLGLLVGHTGRGVFVLVGLANGLRAVPTLGLLILLAVWISDHLQTKTDIPYFIRAGGLPYFIAALIVLVLLALPPILTNTYAGVQNVDPAARDAARGMGMTGFQVLRKVEFPCALPLIMSGLRSATLQVIATVAVAAYLPFLGGLGRFIIDGSQVILDLKYGYPAMLAAGITVALLAVLADAALSLVQRYVVSPGLSGRNSKRSARRQTAILDAEAQLADA
ncbi:MAG: osmoprotectant transport system permease protein [Pseudonocardiales bacterium]|jgi:osmoprotectant transport system permease protein|nr:osmoprotectant transport system permease protein [Pseudonocardiales bacterium]